MVSRTWIGGTDSDVYDPANWSPPGIAAGDSLIMNQGTANVSGGNLYGDTLAIGGSGTTPSLTVENNATVSLTSTGSALIIVPDDDTIALTTQASGPNTTVDETVRVNGILHETFTDDYVALHVQADTVGQSTGIFEMDGTSNVGLLGTVDLALPVIGTGVFQISRGFLEFGGEVSEGETVDVSMGSLIIDQTSEFAGVIDYTSGMGSTIRLGGVSGVAYYSYDHGMFTLYDSAGHPLDSVRMNVTYGTALQVDLGSAGVTITPSTGGSGNLPELRHLVWTGDGSSTDFENPASWTPNDVPRAHDVAIINGSAAYPVAFLDTAVDGFLIDFTSLSASEQATPTLHLGANANLGSSMALDIGGLAEAGNIGGIPGVTLYGASGILDIDGAVTNSGTITETSSQFGDSLSINIASNTSFTNTGMIAGATLSTLSIKGGSFINNGSVTATGTSMLIDSPVSGTGVFLANRGGSPGSHNGTPSTLEFATSVGAGQGVILNDTTLVLDAPASFAATVDDGTVNPEVVTNVGPFNSTIDFVGVQADAVYLGGNDLLLYNGGSQTASLHIADDLKGDAFLLTQTARGAAVTIAAGTPPPAPPSGHGGGNGGSGSPGGPNTGTPNTGTPNTGTPNTGGPTGGGSNLTTPGLAVLDTVTGRPVNATATAYVGPVAGLQEQFIDISTDNLNITASTPNWFIHSGPGTDAIAVSSGTNVVDGGTGSNFLTGGSGTETFFVDDRGPAADIWSTVNNFHSGDSATVWGVTPQDFHLSWEDNQGASGYAGLTAHFTAPGKPTASITLAGYSSADLSNGRLSVAFGTDPASGSAFMFIHGA